MIFDYTKNTHFDQLFDLTFDLSSMMSCNLDIITDSNSMYSTECQHIGKVLKILSKRKKFEMCFNYFNINQLNNSFVNYKMDKSSRIEFDFISEKFKHYYNQSYDWIIEKIRLSVHSSQSVFKTGVFQLINSTNRVINYFEFSKYVVKGLQRPYETNCKTNEIKLKSENELIYSFDDCVNSCIFDKTYGKYKCIQIDDNFIIDLILENKTRDLTFCVENITKKIDLNKLEIFCLRTCQQNCINEYFQVYPYEKYEFSTKTVVIQSENSPLLEYQMNSKFSLFNYASNLGGIISMWFGVGVIDTHKLSNKLIKFLSIFSNFEQLSQH